MDDLIVTPQGQKEIATYKAGENEEGTNQSIVDSFVRWLHGQRCANP
jgi:hypothetical protein